MSDAHAVTEILNAIEQGDARASDRLLRLVYDELRRLAAARLAAEKPGQTLQATALVHEAYLRLVDVQRQQRWDSRGHFFAAAAEAMRRILVENARRKRSQKGGGKLRRVEVRLSEVGADPDFNDLLDLDEALRKLAEKDPRKAKLVELRFFCGLTSKQAAEVLDISVATAERDWAFARAWLRREISGETT